MRSFNLAAIAMAAFVYVAPASAGAYFTNVADWYTQAVVPAVTQGSASLSIMPAQTATYADNFGTYASANDRPYMYGEDRSLAAGQLEGFFTCHSYSAQCLGAHTITYTLPFEITGMAGKLEYMFGYGGYANALPFFGFAWDYWDESTFIKRPGDEYPIGYSYGGFWGRTFDTPTNVLSIVWPNGVNNQDDFSYFKLSNLMVLKADVSGATPGASPVPVPEPASLALFGLGLAGMVAVRRRRTVAAA